jgi:hypothetical protein
LAAGSIHVVMKVENTFILLRSRLQQHCAGAIPKEHAGGAVLIVDDRSHDVAPNDHDLLMRACADKLRSDGEGISKARACRGEIETPGVLCADAVLHQPGRGREHHVGGYAGKNNQVDLLRIRSGLRQQLLCRFRGQVRSSNSLFHAMTLADAGARADQLIVGVHHLFQVCVGDHLRRHVAGDAGNLRGNAVRHAPPVRFARDAKEAELYAMRRSVTTWLSQTRCIPPPRSMRRP